MTISFDFFFRLRLWAFDHTFWCPNDFLFSWRFSVFTPTSIDESLLHPMTPDNNEFQRICMTFTSLPGNGFPLQHLHSPSVLIL